MLTPSQLRAVADTVDDPTTLLRVLLRAVADQSEALRSVMTRDDWQTAAASDKVCTCGYKPYPHPRYPAHSTKPLVELANGAVGS